MKSLFSTLGAFFVVVTTLNAQAISLSDTENYIHTKTYQKAGASASENVHVIEQVSYFDGLGRPKQQIAIKATPDKKDIITHIEYDGFGRQTKDYLPIKASGTLGSFRTGNMHTATQQYYKTNYAEDFPGLSLGNINAYSERIYEASPLNRVLKTGAPGKDWKANPTSDADHSIKFDYSSNSATEVVRFDVSLTASGVPSLKKNGNYKANTLFKNTTKDENWKASDGKNHTTEEFTNLQGQVILKRTYNEAIAHDTYYIYDDFGNLTYVLPPKVDVSKPITASILKDLCYQYQYDQRNRLVEKQIPGKGREYIVYNILDQPVVTQDAIQRSKSPKKQWLVTKYDVFGRVAFTGLHESNVTRIQAAANGHNTNTYEQYVTKTATSQTIAGTKIHYTNSTLPFGISKVYTINYYDDYNFDKPAHTVPTSVFGQSVAKGIETKSLVTGNKVRVLGTDKWISTITYYDKKGRPIYTFSKNDYLQSTDITRIQYDFVGRVLKTELKHKYKSNATITTLDTFTYDHQGRLLTQHQKINNGATELIASNTYDDLGQLEKKAVGNTKTKPLQVVDYKYNVRGWLTGINSGNLGNDLFASRINYNVGSGKALYNGNISQIYWISKTDNKARNYKYEYDALNRITKGISNSGNYDLKKVSYDKMGNILSLQRNGLLDDSNSEFGLIDDLGYRYDRGNKLLYVNDKAKNDAGFTDRDNSIVEYAYDANGNMIEDKNKNISKIEYNYLNLPTYIEFEDSNFDLTDIEYVYDALGNKLKKTASKYKIHYGTPFGDIKQPINQSGNIYSGNFVYLTSQFSSTGKLEFFNQPEGYVEPKNSSDLSKGFNYIYQYKDHLGNIRLSYADANVDGKVDKSEIREEKNYYPFGLVHKGYNNTIRGRKHNYGFNGVEEENELGLDLLSMDLRKYDPAIARWTGIDPVEHHSMSPYNAFDNNPVFWADPSGADATSFVTDLFNSSSGNSVWENANNGNFVSNSGQLASAGQSSSDSVNQGPGKGLKPGAAVVEAKRNVERAFGRSSVSDNRAASRSSNGNTESETSSNFGNSLFAISTANSIAALSFASKTRADFVTGSFSHLNVIDFRNGSALGASSGVRSVNIIDVVARSRNTRFARATGVTGNVLTGLSIWNDTNLYLSGQIGGERLAYRSTVNGLSLGVSALGSFGVIGGASATGAGAIIGVVGGAIEAGYDAVKTIGDNMPTIQWNSGMWGGIR